MEPVHKHSITQCHLTLSKHKHTLRERLAQRSSHQDRSPSTHLPRSTTSHRTTNHRIIRSQNRMGRRTLVETMSTFPAAFPPHERSKPSLTLLLQPRRPHRRGATCGRRTRASLRTMRSRRSWRLFRLRRGSRSAHRGQESARSPLLLARMPISSGGTKQSDFGPGFTLVWVSQAG